MTGYKLNQNFNVHCDAFFDLIDTAKLLWLYLFHEFDPLNDDELITYEPKAILRALGAYDSRAIDELVKIHALLPVTQGSVTEALQCNGGVTHE